MALTAPGYVTGFPGGGLAQFDEMLKDMYGKLIESHLHKATDKLQFMRQRRGRLGGRRTVDSVVVGRSQSAHQYKLERSRLPTPTSGSYVRAEYDAKFAFMRLRETFQSNRLSAGGGRMSFAPQRSQEYKLARETARINAERHCILGQKDILGTVASHAATGSTSVLTMDGREARNSTAPWAAGARYFEDNMSVSIVDASSGAGGATDSAFEAGGAAREIRVRSVGSKHGSSPTVTLERGNEDNAGDDADLTGSPWSFTPADGDFIIPWDSRAASITAGAAGFWDFATPYGLFDLFGSSISSHLYGVSKSTYPTFAGRHDTNSGIARQVTELLLATQADATMNEGGGEPLDFALMESSMRRELAALYQSRQDFGQIVSQSGYSESMLLSLGGHRLPTINDWLFPLGMVHMGVRKHNGWYSLVEYQALDEGTARRFVQNYAQSEEVYVSAGNWVNTAPNSTVTVDDLAASQSSAP